MAWYRIGTVNVVNGSPNVVGNGTDFVSNARVGDGFITSDARLYEVAQIVSATQLVLTTPYLAGTANNQSYSLPPTQSFARDLALNAAELLNTFGAVRDGIGQGLIPAGTVAAPGVRFAVDLDTGIYRAGENQLALVTGGVARLTVDNLGATTVASLKAVSGANNAGVFLDTAAGEGWVTGANAAGSALAPINIRATAIRFSPNGGEAARVDTNGNFGVGVQAPAVRFHLGAPSQALARVRILNGASGARTYDLVSGITNQREDAFSLYDLTAGTTLLAFDPPGNFLVGTTSAQFGTVHTINKNTGAGNGIIAFRSDTTGRNAVIILATDTGGYNNAPAAMWAEKNGGNGRSINAAGTINASGADYAEYMTKAHGCGPISKGDVCGVDTDGRLTRKWADAVSFVVKSTDPSYVGGDVWAADIPARPEEPEPVLSPDLAVPEAPAPFTDRAPIRPDDGEEGAEDFEERLAAWESARDAATEARLAYREEVASRNAAQAQLEDDRKAYAAAMAAHAVDLAKWEETLEEARSSVDRIAFSGQVPCNVAGHFVVGDYVIAAAAGSGIKAIAIKAEEITFDQYRARLGKVWAVRDGRAWIDVQHG